VTVLPSIYWPWTERCLEYSALDHLCIVDNEKRNIGVAASWNVGIAAMRRQEADWLVILSAAIRFNREFAGRDLLDALDAHADAFAVEAGHGMGWHLIAFHRRTFDLIGEFDENFWPAYFEDNDFGRRLYLALDGQAPMWPKVPLEVSLQGFSHGVDLGGAQTNPDLMRRYYHAKWGGYPGEERFDRPFEADVPLWWWPQPCSCAHPELFHDAHEGPCLECTCPSYRARGTA
jgi:hypothetical protein